MKDRFYNSSIAAIALFSMFVFVNCGPAPPDPDSSVYIQGKVTGGGWVETEGGKANFGFNASNCENSTIIKGSFNYHDMTWPGVDGGVKMKGNLQKFGQCTKTGGCASDNGSFVCPADAYLLAMDYDSTNPKARGTGKFAACVLDTGEGIKGSGDLIGLVVNDGPFAGYQLLESTVHGNIQAHFCAE